MKSAYAGKHVCTHRPLALPQGLLLSLSAHIAKRDSNRSLFGTAGVHSHRDVLPKAERTYLVKPMLGA